MYTAGQSVIPPEGDPQNSVYSNSDDGNLNYDQFDIYSLNAKGTWDIEANYDVGNKYLLDLGNTPGHLQNFGRAELVRLAQTRLHLVERRTPVPWTILLGEPRPPSGMVAW